MIYTIDTDAMIMFGDIPLVHIGHNWGRQLCIANHQYCGKLLELQRPGVRSSLHSHRKKTETFCILAGKVHIETPDSSGVKEGDYKPGEVVTILRGERHRFVAIDEPALILEVSTHDDDSDTYREEMADEADGKF